MAYIVIWEERCKGCGLCLVTCPKQLIETREEINSQGFHPATVKEGDGQCTGCSLCAEMCPDVAIEVFK